MNFIDIAIMIDVNFQNQAGLLCWILKHYLRFWIVSLRRPSLGRWAYAPAKTNTIYQLVADFIDNYTNGAVF